MLGIDGIEKGGTNDLLLQPCTEPPEEAPLVTMKQSFMSVFDRHMCYPFFIKLCEHLSIAEIVALTRTCKKYADLYQYLLPMQWNVDRRLRCFVRDPYGFRSQMAKSNALISGSFVFQFFERTSWKPSDLDIFVEHGAHGECANTFQRYLLDKEGYEFSNTEDTEYEPDHMATDCIARVLILTKSGSHANTGHEERECTAEPSVTKIRLVATLGQPIQSILTGYGSTMAVNLMSWNKAYSIFPLSTFVQYQGYQLAAKYSPCCLSLKGYSSRGWNLQKFIRLEEHHLNHPIRKYRRVRDGFTWTIPLDTKNVQWSKIPDQVLEYQSFKIMARIGGGYAINEPIGCHIRAREFMDETLSYRYLCSIDLFRFLQSHFCTSILIEPRDTEPSARPVIHAGTMGNRKGPSIKRIEDPEKSKSRTSRDAEFPDWYRAWERLREDENGFPEFSERTIGRLGPPE